MSEENVEVMRRSLDAFNRGDKTAWLAMFDPGTEMVPAGRLSRRGCRPPTATAPRSRPPPASANWSGASPTPSRAATSTRSSPCSPTTPYHDAASPARIPGTRGDRRLPGHEKKLRGAPLRLVPTRANTQPAFGGYLLDAQAAIARPYGLIVLTLEGDRIAAITRFGGTALFGHFGVPRTLRS
jgi:hypothetical protein